MFLVYFAFLSTSQAIDRQLDGRGLNAESIATRPTGYAQRDARRGMRARISSPLLLLVWSTTTSPRGPIYFPEGLPLSPLSLLSRQRSYAPHTSGRSSCRVYAETGSRGSFLGHTHPRVVFLRTSQPSDIFTTKWCGFSSVASPSRGKAIVVVACTFKSRPACATPFARGGARGFYTGHVYHVGRDGESTCCRSCRVGLGEQARRWAMQRYSKIMEYYTMFSLFNFIRLPSEASLSSIFFMLSTRTLNSCSYIAKSFKRTVCILYSLFKDCSSRYWYWWKTWEISFVYKSVCQGREIAFTKNIFSNNCTTHIENTYLVLGIFLHI